MIVTVILNPLLWVIKLSLQNEQSFREYELRGNYYVTYTVYTTVKCQSKYQNLNVYIYVHHLYLLIYVRVISYSEKYLLSPWCICWLDRFVLFVTQANHIVTVAHVVTLTFICLLEYTVIIEEFRTIDVCTQYGNPPFWVVHSLFVLGPETL